MFSNISSASFFRIAARSCLSQTLFIEKLYDERRGGRMLTKYIPRKITWNVNHSIFWITCHCSALLGAPQIIFIWWTWCFTFSFWRARDGIRGELEHFHFPFKEDFSRSDEGHQVFCKTFESFLFPPLGAIYMHHYSLRGHFLFSFFPTQ